MRNTIIASLAAALFLTVPFTASATVSDYIPVGGVLADLAGDPLDGTYALTFALYDDEVAATAIWSEDYATLDIEDGLFTVYLGSVTALDFNALIAADELWLGLTVGTDSEMNRIPLGSVPFAIEAYQCEYVGDLTEGDIQPMLSGANECPAGTFFRGWDDIATAPICEADDTGLTTPGRIVPPSANTTTTLVATDSVGHSPSITIGTDGLGIIAYTNNTSGGVEVAHCNNVECTAATITAIAAAGTKPDINIGSDGLPVVVLQNASAIEFHHCDDAACLTSTNTEISSGDSANPSVTTGSDGLPIVGFYWTATAGTLRTVHCDDVTCTSYTTNDSIAADFVSTGNDLTSGLGADGMAIFCYQRWSSGDEDVMVAICNDVECTTATAATMTDLNDPRGMVMTIGDDGLPIVVHEYYWGGSVHFTHCNDSSCAASTDSGIPNRWGNTQASWGKHAITIGSNGLPFATGSGINAIPNSLVGYHCSNATCTNAGSVLIEESGAGGETAVTIGVDGNPLIAYRNATDDDLMVTHCSTPMCTPYFRRK